LCCQSYKLTKATEVNDVCPKHRTHYCVPTKKMNSTSQPDKFRATLTSEAGAYGITLSTEALTGLVRYYQLLNVWNSRVHLVAPCTPQEFATRHVLESLTLLKYLPAAASVAEGGAGARPPILPFPIRRAAWRARG